jgi:hypothetical protein
MAAAYARSRQRDVSRGRRWASSGRPQATNRALRGPSGRNSVELADRVLFWPNRHLADKGTGAMRTSPVKTLALRLTARPARAVLWLRPACTTARQSEVAPVGFEVARERTLDRARASL